MPATQLVICGSIAIDRIMNFSGKYQDSIQPDKLHILSLAVLLDKLEDSPGGIGANIAYGLARLGDKPTLIGSVGEDARYYIDELAAAGVDVSKIHYSKLPTASFNVITDSDDNQVGGFYQGAMSDSESVSFLPWKGQSVVAMVSANNPEAMNRQVQECHDLGLPLVYDPGQQTSDDRVDLKAGLETAQVLLVNDYELGALSKKTGLSEDDIRAKVPILITTLGKEGSVIEGTKLPQPLKIGIAKADPKDPTGAGDAYRAGFMYGYLRQWELEKCGQLGAAVASLIIEHHGTQHEFSKQDVIERYKANFGGEIEL